MGKIGRCFRRYG